MKAESAEGFGPLGGAGKVLFKYEVVLLLPRRAKVRDVGGGVVGSNTDGDDRRMIEAMSARGLTFLIFSTSSLASWSCARRSFDISYSVGALG